MKNILLILTIAIVINCKSVSYPYSDKETETFLSEIVGHITANLTLKTNLDSEPTDEFNIETHYSLNQKDLVLEPNIDNNKAISDFAVCKIKEYRLTDENDEQVLIVGGDKNFFFENYTERVSYTEDYMKVGIKLKTNKKFKQLKGYILIEFEMLNNTIQRAEVPINFTIKDPTAYLSTPGENKNDFETLSPRAYRTWEGKNDVDIITDKWIELYREKDKYFLGKANFKIDNGFDECVEVKTKAIVSKNETVLFMDLPELKEGEITSLKIDKNKILPGEKIYFTYNNLKYYIRAEGKIISYNGNELNRKLALDDIEAYTINSNGDTVYATQTLVVDDEDDTFPEVEDYKLFISTQDSKEQLFLQISSFNDSFVTLVFVGDIDRDGKLDFIFDTSRDYEVETKSLYLSSKALPNQIIKLVSVASVQFDC